jgi:hypothetical protein
MRAYYLPLYYSVVLDPTMEPSLSLLLVLDPMAESPTIYLYYSLCVTPWL